jgi:PAS domain S-box-containing protein
MEKITPEKMDEYLDSQIWGRSKYSSSYPELCAEFVTVIAKSVKSTALYTLTHPVVVDSLERAFALLNRVLAARQDASLSITFANDSWLFNGAPVPTVNQEARNLDAYFKAHGVRGINFLEGVRSFELGALCEFLATPAKGQQEGRFKEFLAQKGATNIQPEEAHYVRDQGFGPGAAPRQAVEVRPRPAKAISAPEIPSRPAAVRPTEVPVVFEDIFSKPEPASAPQRPAAVRPLEPRYRAPAVPPAPESKAPPLQPAAAGQPSPGDDPGQQSAQAGMGLGALMTRLVETAIKDPRERVRVYQDALRMIKESLEQQVTATTKTIAEEKDRILNSRTRTENVLSRVAEGKVIVDKEGKILMMNPAAEAISGKRLVDVAGKHVSEHLKAGEHFLTISEDMDLSAGSVISGQVSVAGDERIGGALRRSMALLEDDEGRVVGAYSTLPELTKFKETQRLQEEFLSKITHELQSPLSSISSALEMLTDTANGKLDTDESNFLAISVRNSRRLTEMIRGILDFSKLQSGKMSVHPEPVSIGAIMAEAGEGLLPWAKTKGITLTVRPPAPDVAALADRTRIVQVLTNLISNAIKATPAGGSVLVAASRTANPEPGVIIGVRDTGRGIAAQDLKKIFEKFVQVDSGEPREGVGLGLSIVSELVALHNGKIWAESELGKGATFYFTLPMGDA